MDDEVARALAVIQSKLGSVTVAPAITFAEVWSQYWIVEQRKKATAANAASYARHFLPFFGALPWDQVTLLKAEEYREQRRKTISKRGGPPSNGTLNLELFRMRRALQWATDAGIIPRNPLAKLRRESTERRKGKVWAAHQIEAICALLPPWLQLLVLLLAYSGARRRNPHAALGRRRLGPWSIEIATRQFEEAQRARAHPAIRSRSPT